MANIFDFTSLSHILNFETYACGACSDEEPDEGNEEREDQESLPRYFQVCLVCTKKFANCECNQKQQVNSFGF